MLLDCDTNRPIFATNLPKFAGARNRRRHTLIDSGRDWPPDCAAFASVRFPNRGSGLDPGAGLRGLGLEAVDRGGLFQRQADIVETVEQAVLAEGVDIERDRSAVGAG